MEQHKIVSRDEWLMARRALLAKEKNHTRHGDLLSAQRRALPWVRIDKTYAFDTPGGKKSLGELFGGHSQLVVYHFMFGPDWEEGCPSCSFLCDHLDGTVAHLAQRDVTLIAVSRAKLSRIEAFKERMGWRFDWVSSFGSDFNRDYHVSFTPEELATDKVAYNFGQDSFPAEEAHGISVFHRNAAGEIFHTYSAYARGAEPVVGTYSLLDMVPKGRDEDSLPWPMAWVRHHDRYDADRPAPAPERPAAMEGASASCCQQEVR